MEDTFYSEQKKVRAIIICDPADPHSGNKALKYSHVDNHPSIGVDRFIKFARYFPTAQYINFYEKSGKYVGRIYLTTKT